MLQHSIVQLGVRLPSESTHQLGIFSTSHTCDLAILLRTCVYVFKAGSREVGHSQCNCEYAAIGQAGHEGLQRAGHMDNNTFHSARGPGNGGCGCANMALRPGVLRYNGTAQAELAAYLFSRSKSLTAASGCVTGDDSAWATFAALRCSVREATGGAAWMPCLVPHACSTGRSTALLAVQLGALRVILLQCAGGVLQRCFRKRESVKCSTNASRNVND